ncbi:MAG: aspartyl/asparaginyl beta-hydroxylase domain-containing protein [Methylobacter sp.]|nr:aspartyl/asparaginyl beta-hydroxylase domain-containing protein [Methylobacter sp.]
MALMKAAFKIKFMWLYWGGNAKNSDFWLCVPLNLHLPDVAKITVTLARKTTKIHHLKKSMSHKTRYLKLPFFFDVRRLNEDLSKIREAEWIAHVNTAAYENDWSCVPLRSLDGRSDHILCLPNVDYEDTDILGRCPYFQEVIDTFECEKTSVRLMALGAGSRIKMHTDKGTSFEDGMARLHIPIVTTPEVCFTVEDEDIHFSAGNAWYLNANCLHGVNNESKHPRIHLMLDCIVNPWLEKVFLDAGFVPNAPPKYGDPSINDKNVGAIISSLIAMNDEPAKQMAKRLIAMQKSGTSS